MIIINPYQFGAAPSSLLNLLTVSLSLNGNATKNVGSNDGTATNVTYGTGDISGQAAVFNGTAKISIPDSSDFTLGSNNFAYAIRVKRSLSGTREIFTGQSNTGGSDISISFWLEFTSGNKIQAIVNNATAGVVGSFLSNGTISDTNWHNLVFQRNGTNLELYIDSSLDKATTFFSSGDSINNSAFPWGIGNAGDLSILQFTGSIQDAHLWNGRILTGTEITTLQTKRYPF